MTIPIHCTIRRAAHGADGHDPELSTVGGG